MENTTPTTKPKIVFAKLPNGPEFYACDYATFKAVPGIDLGKKTLPQCVDALKDNYEIAGFLSYGMIIPLVGLIPGHENKRIEDVHERLLEVAADEFEKFKEEFSGPVELPSLGTVGESEAIPRLGTEDLESLKTELSEMRRVKVWLEKRLEAECCTESKRNLESTLGYVMNSIECFEHDLSFMSKSEPA